MSASKLKPPRNERDLWKHVNDLPDPGVIFITENGLVFFDEESVADKVSEIGELITDRIYCG
jgi:hypothetical protein